jgi:hypothetical protein
MLITTSIPNLLGGVSQQPAAIRAVNEAQTVDNAVPSPVEGLTKRPPTEHLVAVANSAGNLRYVNSSETVFVHLIERDETEKYLLVVQENGTPDIYDLAGNRKTLFIDGATTLGNAVASKRKALTIGDVTFLANGNTPVAALTGNGNTVPSVPTNYLRAGLLWIRQANYNRAHIVRLTSGATTSTFTHITRSVKITQAGSSGTNGTYLNVALTYVSGTQATTYPRADITVSGGKVTKVSLTVDGVDWEDDDIDVTLSALSTSIGNINNFNVKITTRNTGEIGTDHVAKALFSGGIAGYIGPSGGIDGVGTYAASTYLDSVIYVQANADFTAEVEDDFSGDGIVFIRDAVERFEDLPPTAPHNYIVKVKSTPESDYDDYWVQFKADNGVFSRGLWEECAEPGTLYKWDKASMPILLIRQSDGTFMLKQADGITPSVANGRPSADAVTVYDKYKWTDRLVGGEELNPFPSFTNKKIQAMVYYQNRLGFMSGDNVIFSEVGQYFNFFRTTILDLLDADPIDVTSASPRVGTVVAATAFNRDLILFTPSGQMVLRGGDVLSPKSIAIIPVADFENISSKVEPIASATSIFFLFSTGGFTGMREMYPQPALNGSYLASDLTASVNRYIPANPQHLTSSTHENMAIVVGGDGGLYCYKYLEQGDSRVQSAWFRFTFTDSSSFDSNPPKAVWAGFVESDLYVVFKRARSSTTSYITIEKIRLGVGASDLTISGKNWLTHLDQRVFVNHTLTPGSYNSATGLTTFTLPKPMSYVANRTKVVTDTGVILNAVSGTAFNSTTEAAGTVSVVGNYSNKNVWIGLPFTMTYEFSTPYLKQARGQRESAIITGRLQLRYLTLQYADSGYFRVEAQIKNESTYSYPFTGEILGTSNLDNANILSGAFRVPLFSRNENMTIKIVNDSPLPSKILSGDLEASYNDRAQRL